MKSNSFSAKQILPVLMILLFPAMLSAQSGAEKYYKMDYAKNMLFVPAGSNSEPVYISSQPVTNKMYILYLAWLQAVYANYPEVLINALPGFDVTAPRDPNFMPFADSVSFRFYLSHSESYVSDYIFNPSDLNSAVIGITWEQANKFCHWLSDRYNEYALIKNKYLYFDGEQRDERNFSTEAYIFRQYEGFVKKDNPAFTAEEITGFGNFGYCLRPSFHLPTKLELQSALKSHKLIDCLCSEPRSPEFLEPFYKFYLRERKGYIYVDPEPFGENKTYYVVSHFDIKYIQQPEKIKEWLFDAPGAPENRSVVDVYRSYGFDTLSVIATNGKDQGYVVPQKDSLGLVNLIITGEGSGSKFVVVRAPENKSIAPRHESHYTYDHMTGKVTDSKGDVFTCFRYAVNALKKTK